eukprot:1775684-Pyramimonas_sp.AAC.1
MGAPQAKGRRRGLRHEVGGGRSETAGATEGGRVHAAPPSQPAPERELRTGFAPHCREPSSLTRQTKAAHSRRIHVGNRPRRDSHGSTTVGTRILGRRSRRSKWPGTLQT